MNKTVLITGAAKGIGAACAKLFAKNGYNVAINYNTSKTKAFELTEKLSKEGANAKAFFADISKSDQVKIMIGQIEEELGNIDVLINNAGVSFQKLFCDTTEDEWDFLFDVNIKGMFLCSKAVLPKMINSKFGRIINISSIWGTVGGSCEVAYSASKSAVVGFTKALAKEEGPSGVTVNCIAPGVIDTDMNLMHNEQTLNELASSTAVGRMGLPKEVAQCALFLANDSSSFITGQVLGIDGGFIG